MVFGSFKISILIGSFVLLPVRQGVAKAAEDDDGSLANAVEGAPPGIVEAAEARDLAQLYRLAKELPKEDSAMQLKILHALADSEQHVPSQFALGFLFYNEQERERALEYFVRAGEGGPHQAALYNAGKIFAEDASWVQGMGYIQACALFPSNYPERELSASLTVTCQDAHTILSEQIAALAVSNELSMEVAADLFMYGSLDDFPAADSDSASLWSSGTINLHTYRSLPNTAVKDLELLESAASSLRRLWEIDSSHMSPLQTHLLLLFLHQDILVPITAHDDSYLAVAAGYAEALALSPYCSAMPACFSNAASDCIGYYRRNEDKEGVQRVLALARNNEATQWENAEQTPAHYVRGLTAQQFWKAPDELVAELLPAFISHAATLSSVTLEVEMTTTGNMKSEKSAAFQTNSFPHVRRVGEVASLSEFGPLLAVNPTTYENVWDEAKCLIVPAVCQALKKYSTTLCSGDTCGELFEPVASILKLPARSQILPHSGRSNQRLVLHVGIGPGLSYTVGGFDRELKNGVLLFDGSFEHTIRNEGDQDAYILQVLLPHPEVTKRHVETS